MLSQVDSDHAVECRFMRVIPSDMPVSTPRPPHQPVGATLVIAYAFAPDADTSAVAAVKRVVSERAPVDVISQSLTTLRGRDESLEQLAASVVRRHARVDERTSFGGWASIEAFCVAGEQVVAQWEAEAPEAAYAGVYSRAHFIASHFLAALIVGARNGLYWRAEISDPLSRRATGERRPGSIPRGPLADRLATLLRDRGVCMPADATTYEWAETLAYTLADEVVFTSEGQREYCLELVMDPHVKDVLLRSSRVDPHATLPREWYEVRSSPLQLEAGCRHVGYFGGFYSSQDPESLFRAVSLMSTAHRETLRIHLFSGSSPILDSLIANYRVKDVVRVEERLPYLDFLAATHQMDALLAIDATPVPGEHKSHVRLSKMSDYLGSETGIWGIVAPGSDLALLDLRWRTPIGHVTGMLQVLTSIALQGEG